MIRRVVAKALDGLAAALAAVYIHGLAAQDLGFSRGLAAGELIPAARTALQRLESTMF